MRDVSFAVRAGELVALIGPNGAGKTTCFNLVNGQLAPDAGTVTLGGERIDGLPPRAIARKGVGRTFQVAATFASMTVRENVQLALLAHAGRAGERRARAADRFGARSRCAARARAHVALRRRRAARRSPTATPSASSSRWRSPDAPRLLLMDEPTAGHVAALARPADAARGRTSRASERIAVLFTEHDMDVVFGHADRVIVLDRGQIIAEGTPAAIRADARVQAVYLGEDDAA